MLIEEDIYVEHFGVKGMHWGVRKERTAGEQAKFDKRKATAKKVAIGAGAAVLIGGAIAGTILVKRRNTKVSDLPSLSSLRSKLNVDESAVKNILNKHGSKKVSSFKPPVRPVVDARTTRLAPGNAVLKGVKSHAPQIKKAISDHNESARKENLDLKKWYDDFNIPIPQREFVELWPDYKG